MSVNPNGSKEQWGSRLGVILAVAGSAVGLGNFLRFPGVAAANGGGTFMIPYVIAFLLLGLPIAWVEWSMGRYGGARGFNSSPGIFRAICKKDGAAYIGVLALLIPLGIYMYYVLIEAWCLAYAWKYWSGGMAEVVAAAGDVKADQVAAARGHIMEFSGISEENGAQFSSLMSGAVPFVIACFVINFILIYRGVSKGIEWFCKWAMPALIVCALIILVRVLTLGTPDVGQPEKSLVNGLGFMWNPVGHAIETADDGTQSLVEVGFWESLLNADVWLAASGQIFFSLSVGFGIIMTYSSYMKKDDDLMLSSTAACAGNGFCEVVLGGLITIPAAFLFVPALEIVGFAGSSFSMGFRALPGVFEYMPLGHFFGGLFFFLLTLAAITSSLSMLQPVIAMLEEGLGLTRHAAVAILGFVTLVGCTFVLYFSSGAVALDTIDFWVGNFGLFVLAGIEVVIFGWVLGANRGLEELAKGAEVRVPRLLKPMVMYVTPLFLGTIFVFWCFQQLNYSDGSAVFKVVNNRVTQATLVMLGVVIVLLALLIAASVKRWRAAEAAADKELS